jgi:hypothetical protein
LLFLISSVFFFNALQKTTKTDCTFE